MTRHEKMQALYNWSMAVDAANKLIEPVRSALMLPPESPVNQALDGIIQALTEATSKLAGDKDGWLDWYANENDFWRKGLEAGGALNTKPIKTLDDLLDLIEG